MLHKSTGQFSYGIYKFIHHWLNTISCFKMTSISYILLQLILHVLLVHLRNLSPTF